MLVVSRRAHELKALHTIVPILSLCANEDDDDARLLHEMMFRQTLTCLSRITDSQYQRCRLLGKNLVTPSMMVAMLVLTTSMFYGVLLLETGSPRTNLTMCSLTGATICLCLYGLCRMDRPFHGFTKFLGTDDLQVILADIDLELSKCPRKDQELAVLPPNPKDESRRGASNSKKPMLLKPQGNTAISPRGSSLDSPSKNSSRRSTPPTLTSTSATASPTRSQNDVTAI